MRVLAGLRSTAAPVRASAVLALLALPALPALSPAPAAAQERPMTFLDMQYMANAGSWTPSPDGAWMLYTVSTPDWMEDERQTDLHVVRLAEGVPSSRRLTFTEDANETQPRWAPDGSFFVFASNRDAENARAGSQLYMMRLDGGEARRITEAARGVSGFDFSPDGAWLVFRAGESGLEQLHALPMATLRNALASGDAVTADDATALTDEPAGIGQWEFSPDGAAIWFTRPDAYDADEKERREKGFTVDVRNAETPASNLHVLTLASREVRQVTSDPALSVEGFEISPDGAWVGYRAGSMERYERNITAERLYQDVFLLEVATGAVERLTENYEVGESNLSFSPDTRWIAFSAPDDMTRYTMTENRVYLRETADRGGAFRKLGSDFDGSVSVGFWSDDARTIYFTTGVKVTTQLHALDTRTGAVRQITNERAALNVNRDEDSGVYLIGYSDPETPPTVFTVPSLDRVADRRSWTQLVDVNPWVRELALGREVEVEWRSSDGKRVGGVLVYPADYREGERYPLIVAIHGGPASADVLRFNGGYGAQVYAGAGYAVLKPNYRGSTNYGNAHRTDIVGDYFTLGYEDIITGVDHLIAEGIVDPDRMGVLGWSAGGHWSNWILTQTDRFKAISSGAGTMNWISMYAQSDVQRNRQFYVGDGFLYEDFDTYFDQSPLKYITNAKTPTMIHVVEGDPRVPSPQSVELHMALKKLGVPTELFMYPGRSHGIPDARNRLVKSVSEMAWMDYYVRGLGEKFDWQMVLETLEEEAPRPPVISQQDGAGN
ncbi:MAG: S9 family peptidase [Longimicrobiales bacterium]|nr:S9 family peptidase [Longimicrobiales bacterium]